MAFTPEGREKAKATKAAQKAARDLADAAAIEAAPPETGFVPKGQAKANAADPKAGEADPQAPPRNLFSGTTKKLEVFGKSGDPNDPIPGYQLYWFDDIEGGLVIQQAKASGYVMVESQEVALNDANTSPGNNDLGGHVRRWVSQGPSGNAIYSYLMKKPNWLHELHMNGPDSMEQRVHRQIDEQLRTGTFNANPDDRRYTATNPYPGTRSNLPPIHIGRSKFS